MWKRKRLKNNRFHIPGVNVCYVFVALDLTELTKCKCSFKLDLEPVGFRLEKSQSCQPKFKFKF